MRIRAGIVADDLTGAADTGVAFLSAGVSVLVAWPGRGVECEWTSLAADVLAVNTRSRAADAEYACGITREVVTTFRQAGVATLYKKIDSTLRGHVGGEVRAAIDAWHQGSLAVVAPAFPGTGRTTVDGYQCVDGVPLANGGFVPALLEQGGLCTHRVDLACVRSAALESTLLEYQRQQETGALVCDAETDEDLEAIARAGAGLGPSIVWVGSGGLARAMAVLWDPASAGLVRLGPAMHVSGPLLIVVGSRSTIARSQADDVTAAGVRRVIVPVAALAGESVAAGSDLASNDVARQIGAHLRAGEDVVVTLGPGDDVEGAGGQGADDPRLMSRLGELLRPCAAAAGGLMLTGGDTALGVLEAWGATAVRLVEEVETGVVLSETIGALAMPVVSKAGSFGDRGTFTRVRQRLRT